MVLLTSMIPSPQGATQSQGHYSSVNDALTAACLQLAIGSYQDMTIYEDGTVLFDQAEIVEICRMREVDPESLILGACNFLKSQPRYAELQLRNFWLHPGRNSIMVKVEHGDGTVSQGEMRLPGWQSSYAGRPHELGEVLLTALPVQRPALRETITNKQYLFIRTMEDLAVRCGSSDEYTMLGIAGLSRLMLWDKAPLADKINSQVRLKFRFRVGKTITPRPMADPPSKTGIRLVQSGLIFQAVEDGFFPHTEAAVKLELTKDQLFAVPVLQIEEHVFTALELMQHMAYIGGVIHAFDPKEARHEALHEFRGLVQVQGVGPGLRTLRAIGRVIFAGLVPLREAVIRELEDPGAGKSTQ